MWMRRYRRGISPPRRSSRRRCRRSCAHADHDFGAKEVPFSESFPDVVAKHRLRYAIIGNDAVFHWPIRDDLIRRAADHLLGVVAYRENAIVARYSDDRRLVEHDSLARDEDEDGGGTKVNAEFR